MRLERRVLEREGFMQYFEKQGNALIFRQDGETVRVEPWQKDSLRVRGTLLSEIEEGSIALLDPEPVEAEIELVDELKATIKNGKIQAVLELQPWGQKLRITFLNQKGEVLLSEIANGGALCLRAHDYRALKGGAYQLKVSFDSNPDEKIYGMGQYQQERMNLKGCNLELAHRNSQASIPFYVSSLGYGFLWHNAAVGEVHFGTNTTEWLARTTKQLDYWVTAGDTPAEIEEHFADAIGKVPMMPEYGLGFWQCKLRYYNQEQVLNVAREYKKRGIPLDVFVIDYYHWPRCGDYRFDEEYFPDPKAMIDELHEMGIETMVSIWPQIDWRSENYEEMKQQGLLVKSNAGVDVQMLFHGNNVFLDATNPRTRKYVWEKVKKNYADLGIRTFWLDEAEPEFSTYEYECYRYAAGPVEEIGNIYPFPYVLRGPERERPGGYRQPRPLRMARKPEIRSPCVVRRYFLNLRGLPQTDLRRPSYGIVRHSVVDNRYRWIPRRCDRRSGLPGAACALVPVWYLLPGYAYSRKPGTERRDHQQGWRSA